MWSRIKHVGLIFLYLDTRAKQCRFHVWGDLPPVRDLLISRCHLAKYGSPSGHGGLKDPTTATNGTPIMMLVATLVVPKKMLVLF